MQDLNDIYQKYAKTVYKYLMSKTGNSDLAEEMTQETFYQAVKSINRFDGSCHISTWLCAIAKNQLLTYYRKHPVQENITDYQDGLVGKASAESEALGQIGQLELMKLLHKCKEPYREVLYLRSFGNLSFAEIGEVMGKSENWARVTFYRAKERLRKEIDDNE